MRCMIPLLGLFACKAAAPPPADPVEQVGGLDDPGAWLFTDADVHSVALTLSDDARQALRDAPFEYAAGDAIIDGHPVGDIGVRIKGKYGSFRDIKEKPSLKFDFNHFEKGQTFYGLKKLNLNNAIADCSYERDRVSYKVFAAAGLPSLRTSYAHVTINDEDYGLYVLVEAPDDQFLDRTFDEPDGNLYDGKYYMTDDWEFSTLVDFTDSYDDYFRLDEGEDVGMTDIFAITDAVEEHRRDDDYYEALGALVDWDQILRHFAVEQWLGQNDGYVLNQNNYFVYFDPVDGRAKLIAWDLDYAFLDASDWGMSWSSPQGVLARYCRRDETCEAAWADAVALVIDRIDTDEILAYLDVLDAASIAPAEADPRRECRDRKLEAQRADVRSRVEEASASLAEFWDL